MRRNRSCLKPGCGEWEPCPVHARESEKARDRERGSASRRGYGAAHRAFRAGVLERDYWCECSGETCDHKHGCQTVATVADHWPVSLKDLRASGLDPYDPARGRGLCKRCHDKQTAIRQRGKGK